MTEQYNHIYNTLHTCTCIMIIYNAMHLQQQSNLQLNKNDVRLKTKKNHIMQDDLQIYRNRIGCFS